MEHYCKPELQSKAGDKERANWLYWLNAIRWSHRWKLWLKVTLDLKALWHIHLCAPKMAIYSSLKLYFKSPIFVTLITLHQHPVHKGMHEQVLLSLLEVEIETRNKKMHALLKTNRKGRQIGWREGSGSRWDLGYVFKQRELGRERHINANVDAYRWYHQQKSALQFCWEKHSLHSPSTCCLSLIRINALLKSWQQYFTRHILRAKPLKVIIFALRRSFALCGCPCYNFCTLHPSQETNKMERRIW